MREKLYDDGQVAIDRDAHRFFIRYDAGSHQIAPRADEISDAEHREALTGDDALRRALFRLQKRGTQAGIDAYVSNIAPPSNEAPPGR